MIKLNDRQLLMDYLKEYPFSRAKDEIQLLQSGDDELINIYFAHHQFKTESKTFILVNGLSEKYGVKLEDIPPRHWRAEALIFTSGNDELIEQYLFAGEAYSKGLTDFGEALLFTHGSLEILDAYMDSKCPSDFAQHAIVSCWNDGLLSLFLHKHNLTFCRKVTAEFLARADTDMALKYLQQIENLPHFLKDDCPEAVTCLCKKNDKKIYQFLLDNDIELDESDCILFAHSAPADLILQYADKFSLGEDAEAELFRRNDKALLQAYLQMYLLEPNNEILLLSLLDVDLIDMYSVEDLDDDTIDYLY